MCLTILVGNRKDIGDEKIMDLRRKKKMIEELKQGNVVVGKYMYSNVLDIMTPDEANAYELASEVVRRSGDTYCHDLIDNFAFSEAFSVKEGEFLVPLSDTYMVNAYQPYRSDLKENDSVLGFAKEIDYEALDKKDIVYIYDLYQTYKARGEMEHGKTYQLKR